jgi:hypothetical protein
MKMDFFRRRESAGPDFNRKAPSKNGIFSCAFGIAALTVFAVASAISAGMGGNAAEPVGLMGISSAMLCVVGLAFAGDGMREREVGYLFPVIGFVINGLLLVYLFWLYIYGLI